MIFSGCRENNIACGVESCFDGILNYADDEADADDLHSDVIGDAKQRAGHRDEKQGTAGDAGSAARAEGRDDGQQHGCREGNLDAQGVAGRKGHDRDGDGRTVHVDGCAERDGDRVHIAVKAESLTKAHVNRNVCRRAPGEERSDSRFLETLEDKRIRVAVKVQEGNERIDDKRHQEHRADQQQKQFSVFCEDGKTVFGDIRENDAHDSERCEVYDPADDERDRIGGIRHEKL